VMSNLPGDLTLSLTGGLLELHFSFGGTGTLRIACSFVPTVLVRASANNRRGVCGTPRVVAIATRSRSSSLKSFVQTSRRPRVGWEELEGRLHATPLASQSELTLASLGEPKVLPFSLLVQLPYATAQPIECFEGTHIGTGALPCLHQSRPPPARARRLLPCRGTVRVLC
jgi:hypothetical protein